MEQEGEKQEFIKIIEELTALIEHEPKGVIKESLIDSIKAKTKVLKDSETIYEAFTEEMKYLEEEKHGPEPREEEKKEILMFGEYIRHLSYTNQVSRTIKQHYESFVHGNKI